MTAYPSGLLAGEAVATGGALEPTGVEGTVYEAFRRSVDTWPDQPCVCVLPETAAIYGIEPGETSYREAAAIVERLADAYRRAGYGHGHRAGLLLENRPAFLWHWLAFNALGVSVVPVNADFRAAELDYLLDNSEMCVAVSIASHAERLRAAAARVGRALVVVTPDEMAAGATPAPAPHAPPRAGSPDVGSECGLLYTSGTTGRPKGCILPNEYYLFAAIWYRDLGGLCALRPGCERLVSPLPLVHMNAMAFSTLVMLVTGGCVVLIDRFHPRTWWESVRESRATVVHYLGVMPAMLLGAPASDKDRGHAVRFGFGAGVDRRHHANFEARFGFPLVEGWAMTETGAGGCIMANVEPRKVGSNCFGKAPPGVAWRVVDEGGADCGADQPGELLVRWAGRDPAFGFFKGYLKDEQASAQAWAGGWFHTGDIVRVDADGDFHFVDRKKNVIRRSGENISAVEVEGALMQCPLVAAAGVAAVPDAVRGDEVMACIVAAPAAGDVAADGASRDSAAAAIVEHCLALLAYYKAPGYVAFCDALPLTATQKIQRGELRVLAQSLVDAPGCVDTRAMKRRDAGA